MSGSDKNDNADDRGSSILVLGWCLLIIGIGVLVGWLTGNYAAGPQGNAWLHIVDGILPGLAGLVAILHIINLPFELSRRRRKAQQELLEAFLADEKAAQAEADRLARELAKADRLAREQAEHLSQQHPPTQLPTTPEPLHQDSRRCTRCNTVYEEGDAFCKKCGLALTAPETKTALATQTMTCPNCTTTVPKDSTFCPKCGSMISLIGTTEATVLVHTPAPSTQLRDAARVNTQAETEPATTRTHTCPACHTRVQLGPEDRFCGNCGSTLV